MKKNLHLIAVAVGIAVLAGAFYWFQYRPSEIVSQCSLTAKDKAREHDNLNGKYSDESYSHYYKVCLRDKGINK